MELNCKISSLLDDLDKLNKKYSWIPSSNNIRPDKDTQDKKAIYFDQINHFYSSLSSFILAEIFNYDVVYNKRRKLETRSSKPLEHKFIQNKFSYNLPKNTNHYVLWYNQEIEIEEEKINRDIKKAISEIINSEKFKYVWYKNPKMNIPGLFHLQVFWIKVE